MTSAAVRLRIGRGEEAAHRPALGDAASARRAREPTASITARTSSMRCSSVGSSSSGTRSESPVPRLSKRISRENEASRRRKRANDGSLPEVLEVRDPAHDEDEVERAVADDLVGDVHVAAARVLRVSGTSNAGRGRRHACRGVEKPDERAHGDRAVTPGEARCQRRLAA